jgi:hypothetical protein
VTAMKVVFKVDHKSPRSKFYVVNKYLRDENGHDMWVETVSRAISYDAACAHRDKCVKYHLHGG